MEVFFPKDNYDTPAGTPRLLPDRLSLNTRTYFVGGCLWEVFRSNRQALAGQYDVQAWARSSYRIFKLVEGCGGRFQLKGLDNLRQAQDPVVFVSNHMSTMETFVFPCIIAPLLEVTFVVKESLVKYPLFGPVMRSRNPIVVGRTNPREDLQTVMTKGQELLANGCSIIIFPQNSRKIEFVPEEFNSLGVKLAKKAGVKVIPVVIKTDFWGNGKWLKEFGPLDRSIPIRMTFGQPLKIGGSGKEEHKQVIEFISSHLRHWGSPVVE